jgi:hypothetical protein
MLPFISGYPNAYQRSNRIGQPSNCAGTYLRFDELVGLIDHHAIGFATFESILQGR